MTDPVGGSQAASATAGTQLAVAGIKTALNVQKQEGEAALKLLDSAVVTPEGAPGQQVDVTA